MYFNHEATNTNSINYQLFLDYVFSHSFISDEETAITCFLQLVPEYQEILKVRFGLCGVKKASSKKKMIEQTGNKEAYDLSLQAFKALQDQFFAGKLTDRESFPPSIACGLGKIAFIPTDRTQKISGKTLLLQMESMLDERTYKIMILRYGLDGNKAKTLKEIGDIFNISGQRVKEIESKSLRILRRRIQHILKYGI